MNITARRCHYGPDEGHVVDLLVPGRTGFVLTVFPCGSVQVYGPRNGVPVVTLNSLRMPALLAAIARGVLEDLDHWPALLDALQDDPEVGDQVRDLLSSWGVLP